MRSSLSWGSILKSGFGVRQWGLAAWGVASLKRHALALRIGPQFRADRTGAGFLREQIVEKARHLAGVEREQHRLDGADGGRRHRQVAIARADQRHGLER